MTRFRFLAGFAIALLAVGLIAAANDRYINGTAIPREKTLVYTSGSQAVTLGALTGTTAAFSSTLSSAGLTCTTLTASSNAAVAGTLGVTGAATLQSTLSVAGASTLTGVVTAATGLTVTGNEAVGGTLAVTGALSTASTLSVTGASTLTGFVTASSGATLAGNLLVVGTAGVTGAATMKSTLAVTGVATFSSYVSHTFGPATAGITQSQAGATALSNTFNKVTTGNANDGVALPSGSTAMCVMVSNISANALKVYGNVNDDDTIDGGSADASVTQAASAKTIWYCTSNGVAWTSMQ